MTEILLVNKCINLYVFHGVDEVEIVFMPCILTLAQKILKKRGLTT